MSQKPISSLFVYGTLMKGTGSGMHQLLASHSEFVSSGRIQAKLYEVNRYPGAVESDSKEHQVFGEVYKFNIESDLLEKLDDYEECSNKFPTPHEYLRRPTRIRLPSGESVLAWVYLYNLDTSNLKEIRDGDFLSYLGY